MKIGGRAGDFVFFADVDPQLQSRRRLGVVAAVVPGLPFWTAFVDAGNGRTVRIVDSTDGEPGAVWSNVGPRDPWLGRAP